MLSGMDTTALLVGVLLLLVGLVIGVLLGRSTSARSPSGVDVAAVLGPASDALHRVERQLHQVERDRVGAYAGLREQVAALHRVSAELGGQTRSLAGALRAPQVRGRWGEMHLQRVVELAGMVEHCDFETQVSARDPAVDGRGVRPDMIIRLSGDRSIPVDAKVPFAAWLEALDCPDDRRRQGLLVTHARAMRAHVDALAGKAYWRHFQPAPEFVVLFVPGEPLLDAALCRRSRAGRPCVLAQRGDRDADVVGGAVADDRLHLAAGATIGVRRGNPRARARAARPARHGGRAPGPASATDSRPRCRRTTERSGPWRAGFSSLPAGCRTSESPHTRRRRYRRSRWRHAALASRRRRLPPRSTRPRCRRWRTAGTGTQDATVDR